MTQNVPRCLQLSPNVHKCPKGCFFADRFLRAASEFISNKLIIINHLITWLIVQKKQLVNSEMSFVLFFSQNIFKNSKWSRPEGLAFTTLLLRIGFTLVFWLMIHENICQKFEKQRSNAELPMPEIQAWILEQLARYFIIIVSSFLLFIALNGQVVG